MSPRTVMVALVVMAAAAPTGARAAATTESVRFEAAYGREDGRFGNALALDGDRAFVSGYEFDESGQPRGAVNEFVWTDDGWSRGDVLRSAHGFDGFGRGIAADGDLLAIGAPGYCSIGPDSTRGRVELFRRIDGSWEPEATIEEGSCIAFGLSLDLAGGVLAVGSSFDHGGAVGTFVYERIDGAWAETAFIAATAEDGDSFGSSVATDGTRVLVGDSERARVYVYERADATWARTASLGDPDGNLHSSFGSSLAMDGGLAVIGAPYADDAAEDAGAAYVFDAEHWTPIGALVAADGATGDNLGWSVAIDGGAVAAGARFASVNGAAWAGAVYRFGRTQQGWEQTARLEASDAAYGSVVGWDVAIADDRILSSSPNRMTACGDNAGVAYLFAPGAPGDVQTVTGECVEPPDLRGPTTTVDSRVVTPPPVGNGLITGESIGRAAPVVSVIVTLRPFTIAGGRHGTYEADLACTGLECTWTLSPPDSALPLAAYRVEARGIDELGNVGPYSEQSLVLVVAAS